ncbi:hypothetical protein [Eremococcus coleocola]|uniref:Uncharacterized protein n=1 Tax=Eremococcus coleocola ACS-139-V-Col8 TaxID=908337 RepID=E4KP97_9LACT|nr:hypothetical protein [Eremococcus coleocola]EFR31189.1 hypothetical protein HMPREF9257_1384 [Eremococcus coleocola ACS-139-V-Col8]
MQAKLSNLLDRIIKLSLLVFVVGAVALLLIFVLKITAPNPMFSVLSIISGIAIFLFIIMWTLIFGLSIYYTIQFHDRKYVAYIVIFLIATLAAAINYFITM